MSDVVTLPAPDFRLRDSGSIWLLYPVSDTAKEWVAEHIPADSPRFRDAIAVEA